MGLSKYLLAGAVAINSLLAQDIAPKIYEITQSFAQNQNQSDSDLEAKLRFSYNGNLKNQLINEAKNEVVVKSHKNDIPLITVHNLSKASYAYTQFLKTYINNVLSGNFEAIKNGKGPNGNPTHEEESWNEMVHEDLHQAVNYIFSAHGQGAIDANLKKQENRRFGANYVKTQDAGVMELKHGGMNIRDWLRYGQRENAANIFSTLVQKSPDYELATQLIDVLVAYGKHEFNKARDQYDFSKDLMEFRK